ncbi:ATP-binding cassette domain-containing protein [Vibrio fluvialis]|uniref:ATP-binding cassette domain-containing protein n=1 Tax=Vibrio fluvialis TaxID=676 RepID=UPI002279531A
MTQSQHFAIELKQIDKRFGAVHANRAIDLQVPAGTIHGIIGENGAGKSTLMSIIYGFYTPDAGEMRVNNTPYSPAIRKMRLVQGSAWFTSTSCWWIPSPFWKTLFWARKAAGN